MVLPSRQQYHIGDYPGTPPPSVYQVTHGTALKAAETCEASVLCGWVVWGIFKNHNKIFCAQMDYGLLDFLSRYGRSL